MNDQTNEKIEVLDDILHLTQLLIDNGAKLDSVEVSSVFSHAVFNKMSKKILKQSTLKHL